MLNAVHIILYMLQLTEACKCNSQSFTCGKLTPNLTPEITYNIHAVKAGYVPNVLIRYLPCFPNFLHGLLQPAADWALSICPVEHVVHTAHLMQYTCRLCSMSS